MSSGGSIPPLGNKICEERRSESQRHEDQRLIVDWIEQNCHSTLTLSSCFQVKCYRTFVYRLRTYRASYGIELQSHNMLSLTYGRVVGTFCAHGYTFLLQPLLWLPDACRCDPMVTASPAFFKYFAFCPRAFMEFTSWDLGELAQLFWYMCQPESVNLRMQRS